MINISIVRNERNEILEIEVFGHSIQESIKMDTSNLVCAGVSSVMFGAINELSMEKYKSNIDIVKTTNNIKLINNKNKKDIIILFELIYTQLKTIEESYKKYITIKER